MALAKETTRGTPVSPPTVFIPVKPTPQMTPMQSWEIDDGFRGSPVDNYNDVPLTSNNTYDFKGDTFVDSVPNLILAALGGPDVVTGTSAPYTHTIKLLNDHTKGSQPPSYTLYDVDLIEYSTGSTATKQIPDAQLDNLDFDFVSTGALTYTSKFIGNNYTEVAYPTLSFTNTALIPAYNCAVSIGAVGTPITSTVVEAGSMSIKRGTESIWTLGAQTPYRNFAGPCNVTGKLTFVALAADPTLVNGLTYSKQSLDLVFTDVFTSYTITFSMDQVQFKNPKVTSGKKWVEVETEFAAEANSTDAATGYSPITAVIANAQSGGY